MVKPTLCLRIPARSGAELRSFCRRLSPEKGVELLIETWKRVSNEFPCASWRWSVTGLLERERESLPLSNVSLDGGWRNRCSGGHERARFGAFRVRATRNFPLVMRKHMRAGSR